MDILLLIIGLGLILAGANFLTDGSAALAQRFRVPEFIIGLTVVAVGTSTPELVVSVLSAIGGQSDVAIGNVVGSNIFNVFVILGVCALIRPVPLTAGNIRRDIPFGVLVSLLLLALAQDSLLCKGAADRIGRLDGAAMLALYILLMWYTIRKTKRPEATAPTEGSKAPMAAWLTAVMIVGGLAGLVFGGEMFLRSATSIARSLGVSESVIAITLVAGGTSLPELASSLVSLFKGKAEMALGNVIGSNIANILLILGVSATIHPLSMGGITVWDLLMVLLSSVVVFLAAFTFKRKAIDRCVCTQDGSLPREGFFTAAGPDSGRSAAARHSRPAQRSARPSQQRQASARGFRCGGRPHAKSDGRAGASAAGCCARGATERRPTIRGTAAGARAPAVRRALRFR